MLTVGVLTNQKAIVFWLKMSRFVCWPSLYYRSSFVSRLTLQIKFANGRMGLGEKIPYMHPMLVICTHPINNKTTISMFTLPTEKFGWDCDENMCEKSTRSHDHLHFHTFAKTFVHRFRTQQILYRLVMKNIY